MNKYLKYLSLIVISGSMLYASSSKVIIENHKSKKLRHGYHYTFFHDMTAGSKITFIKSYKGSIFSEVNGDYNGGKNPKFDYTDKFKKLNYTIQPFQTIRTFQASSLYNIHYHPKKRNKRNLFIKYVINYHLWDSKNKKWSEMRKLIVNQPYEITWCGDGIIDNYIDYGSGDKIKEVCDPGDKTKKNWGNAGERLKFRVSHI